jgi:leader peptidase (prepilin peptidase)/N-methyltransferase
VVAAYVAGFVALLCLSVVDLELLRVPDRILGPSLALVAVAMAAAAPWTGWDHLLRALAGGAAAFAVFCAVHLAVPHGLGFGDVKLSFLLGGLLGWIGLAHVFVGLFAGVLLGAGVGVVLRWSRRLGPRQHVPFVPFLAAGTVLGVLLGHPIVAWWLGA